MNTKLALSVAILLACTACEDDAVFNDAPTREPWEGHNVVLVETSMGDFEIELFRDEAPVTTDNFLRYVTHGFYDGLILHRVIENFMSQGGQFDENMVQKLPTYPPIQNEAGNGLSNLRGTIGMARTSVVHSAQSQFFINARDNLFLDHKDDTPQGYGYAVFGRVKSGMDVVDAINQVPTGTLNGFNDVPLTPIFIEKMTYRGRRFKLD